MEAGVAGFSLSTKDAAQVGKYAVATLALSARATYFSISPPFRVSWLAQYSQLGRSDSRHS
ncbi:MAG TPA: hypothetical protein V6D50_00630 [Chroococcales cyanobacterium]